MRKHARADLTVARAQPGQRAFQMALNDGLRTTQVLEGANAQLVRPAAQLFLPQAGHHELQIGCLNPAGCRRRGHPPLPQPA